MASDGHEYFEDEGGVDLSQFKLPEHVEFANEALPTHEEDENVQFEK